MATVNKEILKGLSNVTLLYKNTLIKYMRTVRKKVSWQGSKEQGELAGGEWGNEIQEPRQWFHLPAAGRRLLREQFWMLLRASYLPSA